jgi:hypothetical protein
MKRSMIAVSLLLLSPGEVIACYEDHGAGAGWFDQQTMRWSGYGNAGQATQTDKLLEMSLAAGVSGVVILLGVVVRTMIRAAGRAGVSPLQPEEETPLVLPFDGPACEPYCGWSEPDFEESGWSAPEIEEVYAGSATWAANSVNSF